MPAALDWLGASELGMNGALSGVGRSELGVDAKGDVGVGTWTMAGL